MDLARCVLSECQLWMLNAPRPDVLAGAGWAAQLGTEWPGIIERSFGDGTMAILLTLTPRWRTQPGIEHVIILLQQWFGQIGYETTLDLVENALYVYGGGGEIQYRGIPSPRGKLLEILATRNTARHPSRTGHLCSCPEK